MTVGPARGRCLRDCHQQRRLGRGEPMRLLAERGQRRGADAFEKVANTVCESVGWARMRRAEPTAKPKSDASFHVAPSSVVYRAMAASVHTMFPSTGLIEIQIGFPLATPVQKPPEFVVR